MWSCTVSVALSKIQYLDNWRDIRFGTHIYVSLGMNSNISGVHFSSSAIITSKFYIFLQYSGLWPNNSKVLFEYTGAIEANPWEKRQTLHWGLTWCWSNTAMWACLQAARVVRPSLGTTCHVSFPSTFPLLPFSSSILTRRLFIALLKEHSIIWKPFFLAQSVYSWSLLELAVKWDC